MAILEEYQKFVSSEKELERLNVLSGLGAQPDSRVRDILLWHTMLQIPARKERSRLGIGMRMSPRPSSIWALLSVLTRDSDHEIVGDAINAMTFSKNRAFGHRLYPLTFSPEKPQRVLYCVARFSEEANDRRLADRLSQGFDIDVSDAMLARTFNALFKHGVQDEKAIGIAAELVASHINATNMDRKAAVAAILYLCFAGGKSDIQKLSDVRDSVAIPELRRLLTWGLQEIYSIGSGAFSPEDAVVFFERAISHKEPNFSGFGCFSQESLFAGFQLFLAAQKPSRKLEVVRLALNLGNAECINTVAKHPIFGLARAISESDGAVLDLWRTFCPLHAAEFLSSLKDVSNYEIWHKNGPELMFMALDISDWFGSKTTSAWTNFFDKMLAANHSAIIDLFCSQLVSIEKELCKSPSSDPFSPTIKKTLGDNVAKILKAASRPKSPLDSRTFAEACYSLILGSMLPQDLVEFLVASVPVPNLSWVSVALAATSMQWSQSCKRDFIVKLLQDIDLPVQDFNCSQAEYVAHISSYILSVLVLSESSNGDAAALEQLNLVSQKIQAILDALLEHGNDVVDAEEDVADWSGHVASDKPVSRWNIIAQVCGNHQIAAEDVQEYEQVLKEAIRVAPHVEKRWVIRALVKLNTDDAIKAVLYQAFQHVDSEFVAHTIRELLKSKHPRAQQALIRAVGRHTVSDDLKLQILDEMALDNPIDVMRELKTLELLKLPQHIDEAIRDAVGRVAACIDKAEDVVSSVAHEQVSIGDVDTIVRELLPNGESLSVDTRSALRTAEMILIQSQSWGKDAVDLSPIVNMHCKAVELAMREVLEPWTDAVMRKGVLSRKLDIIGYARPIPEKMQIFEDFLASLPVVKTIPYFSRFKLRKMLRAICLYRPGKRFTLDGPKAFALLLLVASRKQCQFGLANLFDVGFKSDSELFEFIKLVHSLQDSRNRAVHEGLTWDAKDDIESMKIQAYRIIELTQRAGQYLVAHGGILANGAGV